MSEIQLGIVNYYDSGTQTAEVTSFDGSSVFYNCTTMMQSCDPASGAYNASPPSVGAPCLICNVGGENVVLGYYAPPTLSGSDVSQTSSANISIDRSRDGFPDEVLPGESVVRTKSGCTALMGDQMFKWEMSPALYMMLNMVGNSFNTCADRMQFTTPGSSVLITTEGDGTTNYAFSTSKTSGGAPAVEVTIGNTADVYNIKIGGQQFLHVDNDRNVVMNMKTLNIIGDSVDMTQCQAVALPG